jgi:hypothetical protein
MALHNKPFKSVEKIRGYTMLEQGKRQLVAYSFSVEPAKLLGRHTPVSLYRFVES